MATAGASISKHIRFDEEAGPSRLQQAESDTRLLNLMAQAMSQAISAAFATRDAEEASRRIGGSLNARNVSNAATDSVRR